MNDNTRLTKNTILLYIRMLFVMAISLYTTRIILQNLGVVDFGLYSVVGGISVMFVFLNTAMNSSTQRYLSIAIGKGDDIQLHKIFNVSCIIHTLIGLVIIIICEAFGLWFIYNKMTIPEGREIAVFWTFQLSLIATFVSIVSVPYTALIISREKMGAFAYISIVDVFLKLLVAIVISHVSFDRLIFYALLMVSVQVFTRLFYTAYCKKNFRECKFKFYRFDKLYKEMIIFASWGLLGHFSWIINTSLQDMMLNVFFSPVINAARSIAMRVSAAVSSFSDNFQTAVSPQITKSYATGDLDRTFVLIYNSSRISLLLVWLLSFPVLLCMDDILNLWLTEVPDNTSLFLSIILFDNLIRCLANPLNMAIRAQGNIRWPEIIGGTILIINLPLSYIFLSIGFKPYIVFVIMLVCDMLCHCARIFFSNKYLGMPLLPYIKNVIFVPMVAILISSILPVSFVLEWSINNRFINIGVVSLLCFISIIFSTLYIGMNSDERHFLKDFALNKIRR